MPIQIDTDSDSMRVIPCNADVLALSFSNFVDPQSRNTLLAYSTKYRVVVLEVHSETLEICKRNEHWVGMSVHKMTWGKCSLSDGVLRYNLFCANQDFSITKYTESSNSKDPSTFITYKPHKSYVNEIAASDMGDAVASVSDDHTCKVWLSKCEGFLISKASWRLLSPGISVKWRNNDQEVIVAERSGIVRWYNVQDRSALYSFNFESYIIDYDINPAGDMGALTSNNLWSVFYQNSEYNDATVHPAIAGAKVLRFSRTSNVTIFAIGGACNQNNKNLSLINYSQNEYGEITENSNLDLNMPSVTDISWHCQFPICAVACRDSISLISQLDV